MGPSTPCRSLEGGTSFCNHVRGVLVTQSCPAVCHPMDYSPLGSPVHGILQARVLENFLLQGIFPTQGSNLGLLHCRQIPYHPSHLGSRDVRTDGWSPSFPCISV